jgi:hypothetical protein
MGTAGNTAHRKPWNTTDRAHLPAGAAKVPNLQIFQDLVDATHDRYTWPTFDENRASSLC